MSCPPRGRDFATKIWGPSFWKTLHLSAVNYRATNTQKRAWRIHLKHFLPAGMPCAKCRRHYLAKEKKFDYRKILKNRLNLMRFLVDLHDSVTKDVHQKLGKKFKAYGFDRHCRDLRRMRSRSRSKSRKKK